MSVAAASAARRPAVAGEAASATYEAIRCWSHRPRSEATRANGASRYVSAFIAFNILRCSFNSESIHVLLKSNHPHFILAILSVLFVFRIPALDLCLMHKYPLSFAFHCQYPPSRLFLPSTHSPTPAPLARPRTLASPAAVPRCFSTCLAPCIRPSCSTRRQLSAHPRSLYMRADRRTFCGHQ